MKSLNSRLAEIERSTKTVDSRLKKLYNNVMNGKKVTKKNLRDFFNDRVNKIKTYQREKQMGEAYKRLSKLYIEAMVKLGDRVKVSDNPSSDVAKKRSQVGRVIEVDKEDKIARVMFTDGSMDYYDFGDLNIVDKEDPFVSMK